MDKITLNTDISRECQKGWYPIIDEALSKIQNIVDEKYLDIYICQIKEKFGELRIYLSSYNDEIEWIIDEAMDKSLETCEVCGKPGKLYNHNNWYITRCEEHNRELDGFINKVAKNLFGRSRTEALQNDICIRCGKPAIEFNDELSRKEYGISGWCQDCQDELFPQYEKFINDKKA